MAAALQIWSATFSRSFDVLPSAVQTAIQAKMDDLGARLANFPHQRLKGRPEFKLRHGDYRVLYEFDLANGRVFFHFVGHRRDIYKSR